MFLDCVFNTLLRKESHDGLADRSAVRWISSSHARCQANASRRFDLVHVNYLAVVINAQVDGFAGLEYDALQKRPSLLAKIKLRNRLCPQLEQLQPKAISAGARVSLEQPMTLEHHDQPVCSTLVEFQRLRYFTQRKIGTLLREGIKQS